MHDGYRIPDFCHFFMEFCKKVLRIPDTYELKIGKICNFWTFSSIARNVQYGRDYICAKLYALVYHFAVFFQKSGGLVAKKSKQ